MNRPLKNEHDIILSIDNGTQSVRALLFDLKGNLLAISQIELEAYFSAQPGWAEQSADYFWEKLNANGKTLRPAIIWLDQRLAKNNRPLPWYWRMIFKLLGQTSAIEYFRSKAQANWIAQEQPEIWKKTNKFLLLSGFLTYKLTNQYKESAASNVGYLPFDYKKQQWASKNDWKWRALPLLSSMLPELVKPGKTLGVISKLAAELTGIKQGLPLIAAASDKACEVLGSGCFEPSTASLSYGTTATINTNNSAYIEPQSFIPPYPSAIPGQYNSEVMIYRGFWMVNWFKRQFGQPEILESKKLGVSAESLFDRLVSQVPPGSMGLMLQPYWSPGIKNREAKGTILGFGDIHTRAHIYRSILEGLAYALREYKDQLEKKQAVKITSLRVSGGGSQSDAAMQLTADLFNLPASRLHTYETSGLGAAINAAVGMGYFENYQDAIKAMTRVGKTFTPNKENVQLYDQLYHKVYRKIYSRMKPIYQQIKKITGYPE